MEAEKAAMEDDLQPLECAKVEDRVICQCSHGEGKEGSLYLVSLVWYDQSWVFDEGRVTERK